LKVELTLELQCKDSETARKLERVMSADNVGVPTGQRFGMSTRGRSLVFEIESDSSSAFTSCLSVLHDATLFQEIWLLSRTGTPAVGRKSHHA
jgi:hypothetical protein